MMSELSVSEIKHSKLSLGFYVNCSERTNSVQTEEYNAIHEVFICEALGPHLVSVMLNNVWRTHQFRCYR